VATAVSLTGYRKKAPTEATRSFGEAQAAIVDPGPLRLTGALATGQVASTTSERIRVGGLTTVVATVEVSAGAGGTISIFPMLGDAGADDTVGTRATNSLPTPVTIAAINTQYEIVHTVRGEAFIEVEVSSGTITFVDVQGQ